MVHEKNLIDFLPIPDPGSGGKKAPDPGPGSETLYRYMFCTLINVQRREVCK
jgi:hypothetical protein